MTRADIIKSISEDRQYLDYCRYICRGADVYKDLYQYVILYICELPEAKILEVSEGNIRAYIRRIIYINANYKNTPFYKEYSGGLEIVDAEISQNIRDSEVADIELDGWREELSDNIDKVLDEEVNSSVGYPWKVMLFKIWMKEGSYRKVARKTKIPYPTVRLNILYFFKKINEYTNNHKQRVNGA